MEPALHLLRADRGRAQVMGTAAHLQHVRATAETEDVLFPADSLSFSLF